MVFIDELRDASQKTGIGKTFFRWYDTTEEKVEPENIEVYLSAFLAGCQYHSEQMDGALAKDSVE